VWQIQNSGGGLPNVLPYGQCGTALYDMPGDAAWLGNYPYPTGKRVFDAGQAAIAAMGFSGLGKEWILWDNPAKPSREAVVIADLEPEVAQKLCASYRAQKKFCEVKKAKEITPPFSAFWR